MISDKINFENSKHVLTAGRLDQCPQQGMPEVVFAGRSNVGKSSLLNTLCGSKSMARVSQNPGKTRLLLYFRVDGLFYLVDLPGYGFARASHDKIKQFNQLADAYLMDERPIALTLLLVDIRRGPGTQDLQMLEWLSHNHMNYMLVFTKADKFSKAQANKQMEEFAKQGLLPDKEHYCIVSSQNGTGIEDLRRNIEAFVRNY